MAHQLRAQVTLTIADALPENFVTNTWYFDGGDVGATPAEVAEDAQQLLQTFYAAIDSSLAENVNGPANIKWYNLADGEPRVPIRTSTIAITEGVNDSLPHELAVVLSFSADVQGDIPIERRRGRVYLGPMSRDCLSEIGGQVMISDAVCTQIANAAKVLMDAGDVDKHWAIYSPTTHLGRGPTGGGRPGGRGPLPAIAAHDLEDSVFDVTKAWVDNAWDIQRRRGPRALSRVTVLHA